MKTFAVLGLILVMLSMLVLHESTSEQPDSATGISSKVVGRLVENEARVKSLSRDVQKLKTELQRLSSRLDTALQKVEQIKGEGHQIRSREKRTKGSEVADAASIQATVVASVKKQIDEKFQQFATRKRTQNGEWIAPIDELAEVLLLNPEQRRRATEVFNDARDRTYELLSTERPDGGSLVDDLVLDLKGGMPPPEAKRAFFEAILSETIPETDVKYLSRLMELRRDVFESLAETLSADQEENLDSLRIDPLRVDTGYDPIRSYVEQALSE